MENHHNGPGNYDNTEVPEDVLARVKASTGLTLPEIHTIVWGYYTGGTSFYYVYPMAVSWAPLNRDQRLSDITKEPTD
jgi:hypothetical protein